MNVLVRVEQIILSFTHDFIEVSAKWLRVHSWKLSSYIFRAVKQLH